MDDFISRQAAIEAIEEYADRLQMVDWKENPGVPYKAYALNWCINTIRDLPSAQPEREDYTEMKREFIRMAGYIDSLLVCSDEQKETLMNFISRLAEFMPWTERD